jgi:Aminotransferase class I and II
MPELPHSTLLGSADSLLLPTLTHIHASVIPVLASDGTVFVDARAHKTIWDGCVTARAHGATVVRYAHDDPEALERALCRHPKVPRLVCMDGVNSMTGNPPQLPAFLALARDHDALLYVDDAHGFGVVGERDRSETSPYGRRGNGVVRHLGESYDHVVLTGGFSKAYSPLRSRLDGPGQGGGHPGRGVALQASAGGAGGWFVAWPFVLVAVYPLALPGPAGLVVAGLAVLGYVLVVRLARSRSP